MQVDTRESFGVHKPCLSQKPLLLRSREILDSVATAVSSNKLSLLWGQWRSHVTWTGLHCGPWRLSMFSHWFITVIQHRSKISWLRTTSTQRWKSSHMPEYSFALWRKYVPKQLLEVPQSNITLINNSSWLKIQYDVLTKVDSRWCCSSLCWTYALVPGRANTPYKSQ